MMNGLDLDDPAYFARLARVESAHWWPSAMRRIASAWLDRALIGRTSLHALDIGSGAGGTLAWLGDRPEIEELIGIEPNDHALMMAKSEGHAVVRGDALHLPFSNESFDLLACLDVLQHLPDGAEPIAAREMLRVLKPGGHVLIRANGRGLWPAEPSSSRPYRVGHLTGLIASSGLRVFRSTYVNCLPAIASEVLGQCRPRGRLGHPSGRGLRIDVRSGFRDRAMGWISSGEAILAGRWGVPLPVGHSTMILASHPEGTP